MAFIVEEHAVQLIRELRPLVGRLDASLRDQIRRAANSVAFNVSEGGRRMGKDRVQHFRIAAGSAAETRTAVRTAVAWGYVPERETSGALDLLDQILAILWRLTHPRVC